jgi:hypothetical protein
VFEIVHDLAELGRFSVSPATVGAQAVEAVGEDRIAVAVDDPDVSAPGREASERELVSIARRSRGMQREDARVAWGVNWRQKR